MERPPARAFRARPRTYGSGSPKPDAGPVIGLTKPILMLPLEVEEVDEVRQASRAPGIASPPRTSPVPLSISRRVIPPETFLLLTSSSLTVRFEVQEADPPCTDYRSLSQ